MTTPIDRESVEQLADRLSKPQSAIRPTVSDGREGAKTILALRAALDATEAEKQLAVAAALRQAADTCEEFANTELTAAGADYAAGYSDGADRCSHAILALIPDAGAALDRTLAAQIEKDAKVAETHPMRFAGQTEDDVRAALAAAIRAQ